MKRLGVFCPDPRGTLLWSSLVGKHVATVLSHKTHASHPTPAPRVSAPPLSIAILGNDAFLAASPAVPVQLMHAALAAGFDSVVPASLGDELVAGETIRLAQLRGRRPVVQCACPFALSQLCKREANLADVTIAVAPAAVALARALRLDRPDSQHITYIGACPGAEDPAIDLQVMPAAFLRGLEQKGVSVTAQPDVFTDRLPPDRRRYLSLPGGAPRADVVDAVLRRNVVSLSGRMNPLLAVADALFDGGVTMIDPAGAYRCACAGADADAERSVADGRAAIARMEPSRAMAPIFDAPPWLDLRPTTVAEEADAAPASHAMPGSDAATFGMATFGMASLGSLVERDRDADAAQTDATSSQRDTARRMYALGVRTARRRGGPSALTGDAPPAVDNVHVPPTARSLHAPSLDHEVPLPVLRERIADMHNEPTPTPPTRRSPSVEDLFHRD